MSKHIVCGTCGELLECDWMSIGLDYDDECEKSEGGYHTTEDAECTCEEITSRYNVTQKTKEVSR